jgi:glycosyltransferase involved in cell wall biosynthesis
MKLGVDARLLSQSITGIGRYLWQMSSEFQAQGEEIYLYMPGQPVTGDWSAPTTHVRATAVPSRVGRMLWSQTVMPYQATRDQVDLFWGAAHRLPRYLPASMARVVTIHDLVWKFAGETMRPLSRWMDEHLMPAAVKQADLIVAVSHSTAQAIEEVFPCTRGRVRVIHLGATRLAEPGIRSTLSTLGLDDRPYFLFVGTLEPRKNLRRLLNAYASLPEALRDRYQFVIAGGRGWGGVDVVQLVNELGIAHNVVITGYVDDAQLAGLYAHARFLAMPSLYEGFGLPLVEAMSYGAPVLTSNVSSLPEVAADAGILVDPLDEASIANGLQQLFVEDELHQRLTWRAKSVAAQFSWANTARETWVVFEEALADRRAKLRGR